MAGDVRWATRNYLHLERVASSWLIRRFIDPEAEFVLLERGEVPPAADDLVPFGLAGVALAAHDPHGTLFGRLLDQYELDEPALWGMERLVAAGIGHSNAGIARPNGPEIPTDLTEFESEMGAAIDFLGTGFGITFEDPEQLELALPMYDAIYTLCRLCTLPPKVAKDLPEQVQWPERVKYLRTHGFGKS
jgi:hypothetical protein